MSTTKRHVEKQVAIPSALADMGQVERAWTIAAAMPRASRSAVIAACEQMGIPHDVAAPQVQRQRYGQKAAATARHLPKLVRQKIVRAAHEGLADAR